MSSFAEASSLGCIHAISTPAHTSEQIDEIVSRIDQLRSVCNPNRPSPTETEEILDGLCDFQFLFKSEMMGLSARETFPTLPFFYVLTFAEINRITNDDRFRSSIAERMLNKSGVDRDFDHVGVNLYGPNRKNITVASLASHLLCSARLIRATRFVNRLPARTHLTYRDFLRLVSIEDLAVVKFTEAYRYDSRTPELIKQVGFLPNPAKPRGALITHVNPLSTGAFFVSLSKSPANEVSLQSIRPHQFAIHAADEASDDDRLLRLTEKAAAKNWLSRESHPRLQVLYEYKVIKGVGVETPFHNGIIGENEIVVPFIDPDSISLVREVFILVGRKMVRPIWGDPYIGQNSVVLSTESGKWRKL